MLIEKIFAGINKSLIYIRKLRITFLGKILSTKSELYSEKTNKIEEA